MGNMPRVMGNIPKHAGKMPDEAIDRPASNSRKRDVDLLFGSGVRAEVLWVLLMYPEDGLTQGDFSKITGRDPKDVRRALDALGQLGLLWFTETGGGVTSLGQATKLAVNETLTRRYRLNRDHPWVPALKIIFENSSIGAVPVLREEFRTMQLNNKVTLKPYIVFIFGSTSSGEQDAKSDIDLIVIDSYDKQGLADVINDLEKRIGREIHYVEYTSEEWTQALRDSDYFATSILTKPKIFLVGDNKELEQISKT